MRKISLFATFLLSMTVLAERPCHADISGFVKDIDGEPVAGAVVTFVDKSEAGGTYSTQTGADGSYVIDANVTAVKDGDNAAPPLLTLCQNYPNPFNPSTVIPYALEQAGFVSLSIYTVLGQKVRTLVHDIRQAGAHSVAWDGLNDNGLAVGAGVYLYRITSGNHSLSRKMLLLDGGSISHSGTAGYSAAKPAFREEEAGNASYRVTIQGNGIDRFDKAGIVVGAVDSCDFIVTRKDSGYLLSIIHTNDTHSIHLPINQLNQFVGFDDEESFGGAARIMTLSKRLRNQRQNELFLDAGDRFERMESHDGVYAIDRLATNMLNYNFITLGNWDFSYGLDTVTDYLNGLHVPVVLSNLSLGEDSLLSETIKPSYIIERGGQSIGIVGCITNNPIYFADSDLLGKLNDIMTAIQNNVDDLLLRGVSIIVAVNHVGYMEDKEIASAVSGIDIIVGGHSHSLLSNTVEKAQGPYPTVVNSPSAEPVLIVQAGYFYKYLGCLDVLFDDDGVAAYWTGKTHLMDSTVPHDSAMVDLLHGRAALSE